MTPRDANWVPQSEGGTGKWEEALSGTSISAGLDDDEYVTAILRPELLSQLTHQKMVAHSKSKEEEKNEKEADDGATTEKLEAEEDKANSSETEAKEDKEVEENEKQDAAGDGPRRRSEPGGHPARQ